MISPKQGRSPEHAIIIELVTRPRGASAQKIAAALAARRSFIPYSKMTRSLREALDRSAARYIRLLRAAFFDRGIALVKRGDSYVIIDAKHLVDSDGDIVEVQYGRKKYRVRRECFANG